MAYSLSNKCAKNCCKWTVLNLSLKTWSHVFLEHSVVTPAPDLLMRTLRRIKLSSVVFGVTSRLSVVNKIH